MTQSTNPRIWHDVSGARCLAWSLAAVLSWACSGEGVEPRQGFVPNPEPANPEPIVRLAPANPEPVASRALELGGFFARDAELSGVGVDSASGEIYLLEARTGVYRLEADRADLVVDLEAVTTLDALGQAMPSPTELTDLAVRVADGVTGFVVTAENDGFLASPHNDLLRSFFCYEPGFEFEPDEPQRPLSVSQQMRLEGVAVFERAEAIAVRPDTLEIYAQPRTHRQDDRQPLGSELFRFDPIGGDAPVDVQRLSDAFSAGGMAVRETGELLFGAGSELYAMPAMGGSLGYVASLSGSISGMAYDVVRGELLVLDGAGRRLHVIDDAQLGELSFP